MGKTGKAFLATKLRRGVGKREGIIWSLPVEDFSWLWERNFLLLVWHILLGDRAAHWLLEVNMGVEWMVP